MGTIMGVDLASKMSAYTVLEDSTVLKQGDSWGEGEKTRDQFVRELGQAATRYKPDVMLIEDLPHGLKFMTLVKSVIRLQGRIEQYCAVVGTLELLVWVPPVLWKKQFGLNGKDTAKLIEPKAKELFGYTSPVDFTLYHGKQRTAARKVATDYCAAYLISRWGQEMYKEHGTYDLPTTHRSEV